MLSRSATNAAGMAKELSTQASQRAAEMAKDLTSQAGQKAAEYTVRGFWGYVFIVAVICALVYIIATIKITV